jgi:Glycosyl hydrolases family 18
VRATAIPAHVYAPYFEVWTPDNVFTIASHSGVKYLTLAFLQTSKPGSCLPDWNGDASEPFTRGRYLSQIKELRASGGDVIPSFGGYGADSTGTELADSCTSVPRIVADYESLVRFYGVSRLDFDIESKSLGNPRGINRRDRAITQLERWASKHGYPLQVSFTMPASAAGLVSRGVEVLKNAIANHTRVDVVNIMTFDYYNGTTKMGAAAISAGEALHAQLARLYPTKSSPQLYAMEGITLMPGIDDNPAKTEVTSLANTRQVFTWAKTHGVDTVSIWAIQRDNGACPGVNGSNSCSGIRQPKWAFSHILEPFTS